MVDRLLRVVGALVHNIRRALGLELGRGANAYLTDWPVLAEQVVQIGARDVEVAVISYLRYWRPA